MEFGKLVGPLALSVLYPRNSNPHASPKAISGRTSYHQVRLAFHPYPHLIEWFFNTNSFEPSRKVNCASLWTWIDHLASGLLQATDALFRLAFASATDYQSLTSQLIVSHWLILQKARYQASTE